MKLHLKIVLSVLIIVLLSAAMLAIAHYVPNSLHTNSDFLAIYDADLRLLQHIKPYDYQGQIRLMAEQTANICRKYLCASIPLSAVVCAKHILFGPLAHPIRRHAVVRDQFGDVVFDGLVSQRRLASAAPIVFFSSAILFHTDHWDSRCRSI